MRNTPQRSSALFEETRGFAIPAAVLVIVVVSLLALSGLYLAQTNTQATSAISQGWKALYAADAGAARTLATWYKPVLNKLDPGDSVDSGWQNLPDGSRYRTTILRIDDGASDSGPYLYRVRTAGRPSRRALAERVVVTLVEGNPIPGICCDGALKSRGELTIQGFGNVIKADGLDAEPPIWAGQCSGSTENLPGIVVEDTKDLKLAGKPRLQGSPPVKEDETIDDSDFDMYENLVQVADKRYPGDRVFSNLSASSSGGVCSERAATNWGDPLVPGAPCWDYVPVIHVAGDLRLFGDNYGQGILLVDGNLETTGTFDFYGIVIVKGEADIGGTPRIYGGVIIGNGPDGSGRSFLRGNEGVHYSSCVTQKMMTEAISVRPLKGRHWFEVLN